MRYNPKAMRRVLRTLLKTLTVLSLVLCVAVVVMWVWSYSLSIGVEQKGAGFEYRIGVSRGSLGLIVFRNQDLGVPGPAVAAGWHMWTDSDLNFAAYAWTFTADGRQPVLGFFCGRLFCDPDPHGVRRRPPLGIATRRPAAANSPLATRSPQYRGPLRWMWLRSPRQAGPLPRVWN